MLAGVNPSDVIEISDNEYEEIEEESLDSGESDEEWEKEIPSKARLHHWIKMKKVSGATPKWLTTCSLPGRPWRPKTATTATPGTSPVWAAVWRPASFCSRKVAAGGRGAAELGEPQFFRGKL